MRVVPENATEKLMYFEAQIPGWAANAEAIGTTAGAIDDLAARAAAARAAAAHQTAAQAAARAATLAYQIAIDALGVAGAAVIGQVRARAATAGDAVYALAMIPPPATPSKVAPPGTPTDFAFALDPSGNLALRWACANPRNASGTIYHVSRRIGADLAAPFVFIGGSGDKRFVDDTIPAGTVRLTYEIQAVRSTSIGVAAQFVVNFGIDAETIRRRAPGPKFRRAA